MWPRQLHLVSIYFFLIIFCRTEIIIFVQLIINCRVHFHQAFVLALINTFSKLNYGVYWTIFFFWLL